MSFKREGDDASQLNILKKRRVADLLSHFIPEDEAALMKNGRNGKRHLEGLKAFYGKKARLKNEVTKRQHEKYVQSEDTGQEPSRSAPLLEQTRKLTHHALLKTVPYNSCHTKTSIKSDKGLLRIVSDPAVTSCSRRASEQERSCQETEASNVSSQNSSSGCAAAGEGSRPSADVREAAEPLTAQRRRELEHYLKLKSDGWLQDRSGRWVKDENVEFDSDEEEEPPSLTPPPSGH